MEEEFTREGLENQKKLIGEFVILFEDTSEWMRFIIPSIIYDNNTTELQIKNIETLLIEITYFDLNSLIIDNFSSFPDFINTIKILSNKTSGLSKIRNSIVHGSYRLGWKNFYGELSDKTFSLRHSKSTNKGYEKRSKIISTEDLIELNNFLRKVSNCYNSIEVIIRNIKVNKRVDLADTNIKKFMIEVNSITRIKELKFLDILN